MDADDDGNTPEGHTPENSSPGGSTTKAARHNPSCDFCRRLKIKCERPKHGEPCMPCMSRDVVCKTTLKPKKPRPKKQDHLGAMEHRIRQMESALASVIDVPEAPVETDPMGQGEVAKQVGISDNLSMIVINEQGGSRFIGSSSGFSLFSPRGLRWISEKTGNQNLENLVKQIHQLDPATFGQAAVFNQMNIAWHPLPENDREPLPSKELALIYVEAVFHTFNAIFPLFNRAIFDARFERQYSNNPPTEEGWYACLNVVLAIGSAIVRTSHPIANESFPRFSCDMDQANDPSARYLRNATSTFIDLQFGTGSLMSIQAIVGMAILLQGTSNPIPEYTLVAAGARIAHAIGLHRWLDDFGLSEAQADERRDVFWHLYMIDKSISIQTGRPSVIHDQDIGIAFPREKPLGLSSSGKPLFNCFLIGSKLAMIQSRVYSELYSARARTRTVLQRLTSIGKLDTELQKWREAVPIEIRPEEKIVCDEFQLMAVAVMHYQYYNCLTAIHRVSIYHGTWTTDSGLKPTRHDTHLNPRVFDSAEICVTAARQSINTLDYFETKKCPSNDLPLQASLTLFANILQHPLDPLATSDCDLMCRAISILEELIARGRLHFATTSLWIFQELQAIAKLFLAQSFEAEAAKKTPSVPNKVSQMVQDIENFSLPSDFRFPNQYSQDGTFNDDMLMLMGPPASGPIDLMGDFTTEDSWFSPMDIGQNVNQTLLDSVYQTQFR